jgi:tetratricopeptide (TPR) repeat protein
MNGKALWLSILAVIISFVGGFFLANALNKNELETLRTENNRLKSNTANTADSQSETALSDEEIRRKIAEADQNPNNLQVQKNFGTALYQYGAMKKDAKIIAEAARLLARAYEKNPADKETATALGHAYFDIGFYNKDNENLAKARQIYQKILESAPNEADIRTDSGLTYFLQTPPDYEKAAAEMKKVHETNPKHEKSLLFLVQIFIKQQNLREAETYLAKLKEINPNAPSLSEIQTQMTQSESANK